METRSSGSSGRPGSCARASKAAGLFASADRSHPEALEAAGLAGPVAIFARNTLCALVEPRVEATPETLLARMRDPEPKLGTSTPEADPSGDYARAVFARATLEAKARALAGGPGAPEESAPLEGRSVYGWLIASGAADIFLATTPARSSPHGKRPGSR